MVLTNYHTHFELDDGSGPLSAYVETAVNRGFKVLGFSPHAPLPYPNEWSMDADGLGYYLKKAAELKSEYADRLEICIGLEIDYVKGESSPLRPAFGNRPIEYSIGSVHSMRDLQSGGELSVDGPVEELEKLLAHSFGGDVKKLVAGYFDLQMEMLEEGGFDILGHCDLIKKRNGGNRFFDQNESWFQSKAMEMLELAARKDVVIEVNTGGLSGGATTEVYPSPRLIAECRRLDIPLTLCADAHRPEHIDFHLRESAQLMKTAGYGEFYFFTGGKWQAEPI